MPSLRSRKPKQEEQDEEAEQIKIKMKTETMQWAMIVPEDFTKNNDTESFFHKLPHPRTGESCLFLFRDKKVYQLMKCDESYRSWFIDESVQKDGTFCTITPMDPLFLALPYLEKFAESGKFTTLDNMLIHEEHQLALNKLEECLTKANLCNICNCKGSDDIVAYKSEESKILAWLSLKVSKLSEHLMKSDINVKLGSKDSAYIRVEKDLKQKEEECMRYAWSMISDYVPHPWVEKLKENLKIKEEVITQAVKRQKLNDTTAKGTGPVEDYRDHTATKKTVAPKLTSTQKALNKVDKKGMKTMGSFFKSKPKK